MTPDNFADLGIQLPILVTGWVSLALLILGIGGGVAVSALDEDFGIFVGLMGVAFGLLGGVIWLITLVPFDGHYWHDYRVEGHVDSVSNVLSEADGELTRQPVVKLSTVDRPLVVDDPRAFELKGRDVALRCSIGWNFRAADTYSCKVIDFGEVTR